MSKRNEAIVAALKNTKAHENPFFMAEEVAALLERVGSVLYDGDEYHDFCYAAPGEPESVYIGRHPVYVLRPEPPDGQDGTT